MLFILPVTAFYVVRTRNFDNDEESYSAVVTTVLGAAIAFLIGLYDGFYGPGTGTFLILLLTGVARMKLNDANGLAKSINWATNIAALIVYSLSGKTFWILGLIAGLFGIAGNHLGVRLFSKNGPKAVRPVIIIVLVIFFIKTIYELLD